MPRDVSEARAVTEASRKPPVTAGDNAEAMLQPTLDKIAAGERLAEVAKRVSHARMHVEEDIEYYGAQQDAMIPFSVVLEICRERAQELFDIITFVETGECDEAATEVERPPKRLAEVVEQMRELSGNMYTDPERYREELVNIITFAETDE